MKKSDKDEINKIIEKYKDLELPDDEKKEHIEPSNNINTDTMKVERDLLESRKKKRLRTLTAVFSLILILAGIAVFSYPIIQQAISSYKQNQIQEDLKAMILENMKDAQEAALTAALTPTVTNSPTGTDDATSTPYPYTDIAVEEVDSANTESDVSSTKDRLQGQTLFGSIEIESMDLFYAVVEGTTKENLSAGIGHMTGTAGIGEVGNCSLAGHRGGTYGKYFKNIDKLKIGDDIIMMNTVGTEFIYTVYEMFIVEPEEVWILDNVDEVSKTLTLITCENSGTQRLIVRAKIEE